MRFTPHLSVNAVTDISSNGVLANKVFKVYHLTEGLKVMFSHKMLPGCTGNDCPELQDNLMDWWIAWCNYARKFYSAANIKKSQSELADALKQAVDKKSKQH